MRYDRGMGAKLKIIGVGSPFGDDRLGWIAAERLRALPAYLSEKDSIDISILDRPGAALISHWQDADAVILIITWFWNRLDDGACTYTWRTSGIFLLVRN